MLLHADYEASLAPLLVTNMELCQQWDDFVCQCNTDSPNVIPQINASFTYFVTQVTCSWSAWTNVSSFLGFKINSKEHTHLRNNREAVVKTADHPATLLSVITRRLTPAVCCEGMEQLEEWTVCVPLCPCLEESSTWSLHVHTPVRTHQCRWHKAQPRLDLTLLWMPLWRQSGFVWLHISTEEDMEKICGPVSLRDYVAPFSSCLNDATNPMLPCPSSLWLL